MQKIAADFRKYHIAVEQFKSNYEYLPGDLPTASSYWSGMTGNGDGDGRICLGIEYYYAWEQLGSNGSGLLPGKYTVAAPTALSEYNHPYTGLRDIFFGFYTTDPFCTLETLFGVAGPNAISLFSRTGVNNYAWSYGALSARDAKMLDTKIDDGIANLGRLFGVDAANAPATSACSTAAASAGANYNISGTYASDNRGCRLFSFIEKSKP